jgi:hypothetical protein
MLNGNEISRRGSMLLAGFLAASILVLPMGAQAPAATEKPAPPAKAPAHIQSVYTPKRAELYYESVWGIESPSVKAAESGEIIRFSWRVVDAQKAKTLSDKKLEPSLIDPQAGVSLVVPTMEKVGQLRQSSTPEAGKTYWMAFSNPGRMVKPGHHVIVQIGSFRADGLIVQ